MTDPADRKAAILAQWAAMVEENDRLRAELAAANRVIARQQQTIEDLEATIDDIDRTLGS